MRHEFPESSYLYGRLLCRAFTMYRGVHAKITVYSSFAFESPNRMNGRRPSQFVKG